MRVRAMLRVATILFCLVVAGLIAWKRTKAQDRTVGEASIVATTSDVELPAGLPGRYQVISTDLMLESGKIEKSAIRIDTETGKTWQLVTVRSLNPRSVTLEWILINETEQGPIKAVGREQ